MVSIGRLTQAQADALNFPKTLPPNDSTQLGATGWRALIVHQVISDLEAHGISEGEINTRGLVIHTTLKKGAQRAALQAINQTFAHLTKKQRNFKNALVAVDPKTGAVIAYYGGPNGKGYNGKIDNFDYAGIGTRPPGSSFKPYTLATVLTQTMRKAPGKPKLTIDSHVDGSYCVHIQGRKICNDPGDAPYSSSSVTIANAMKWSLNTTFDQLAAQAGPANVAATAHAAGIPAKDSNGNPLLVGSNGGTGFGIGIGDYPVSPIDQAVGFATFANGGTANAPYFVQSATDSAGNLVYKHKPDPHRAIDSKVANDVTLTLEPVAAWSGDALSGGRRLGREDRNRGHLPEQDRSEQRRLDGRVHPAGQRRGVGRQRQLHDAYLQRLRRCRVRRGPARQDVAAVHGHLPAEQALPADGLEADDHERHEPRHALDQPEHE